MINVTVESLESNDNQKLVGVPIRMRLFPEYKRSVLK